ncbi:MAG TPA: hypothetical protein VIV12_16000 [Streptosporangiaceae bacterium]
MRRSVLALACAIVLQLALFQTARAGGHATGSAATSTTATTTTAANDNGRHLGWCDPQPPHGKDDKGHRHCPNTTETTKPTKNTSETTTTTTTTTTAPPLGRGTFTREPPSGPVGTVIHVSSVTSSPLGGDQIAIVALVKLDPAPIAVVTLPVDSGGSWQGSIVVPSNAAVGDYQLVASTQRVGGGSEFRYNPLPFNVVPSNIGVSPSAPPVHQVPPVIKPPTLTG